MSRMRLALLLPFFFLEVRVHAEAIECREKKSSCRIEENGFKAALRSGSLIERRSRKVIQVVRGLVFVKLNKSPVKFNTPYAEFSCPGSCSALIERSETQVTLKALEGRWVVVRLGEKKQPYQVIAGWQMLVSEVTDKGVAEMEFPQSLPWQSTVSQWASIYPGKFADFKNELTRFREVWRESVESASRLHSESANRIIASYQAEQAASLARQKAREKEDQSLRELFRQKNYIDP